MALWMNDEYIAERCCYNPLNDIKGNQSSYSIIFKTINGHFEMICVSLISKPIEVFFKRDIWVN